MVFCCAELRGHFRHRLSAAALRHRRRKANGRPPAETHRLLRKNRIVRTPAAQHPARPIAERLKAPTGPLPMVFRCDGDVSWISSISPASRGHDANRCSPCSTGFSRHSMALAEQYGMEKIKTIGDAYMVAGGLNNETAGHPFHRRTGPSPCATCCIRISRSNDLHLDVRIGIGTGPVVAGVVGRRSSSTTCGATRSNLASRIWRRHAGHDSCGWHHLPAG